MLLMFIALGCAGISLHKGESVIVTILESSAVHWLAAIMKPYGTDSYWLSVLRKAGLLSNILLGFISIVNLETALDPSSLSKAENSGHIYSYPLSKV